MRELRQDGEGGIADPALDTGYVGAMQAGMVGQVLLGPGFRKAKPLHRAADLLANIHRPQATGLQPMELQTMSLICG